MDTFTLLETRRKHVMKYSEKIPSLDVINNALWKAWKTSPSKNNFNPYEVFVLGPEKQKDKDAVYSMIRKAHIRAEDDAVEILIGPWLVEKKIKTDLSAALDELGVEVAGDLLDLDGDDIESLRAMVKKVEQKKFDRALATLRGAVKTAESAQSTA